MRPGLIKLAACLAVHGQRVVCRKYVQNHASAAHAIPWPPNLLKDPLARHASANSAVKNGVAAAHTSALPTHRRRASNGIRARAWRARVVRSRAEAASFAEAPAR